MICTKTIKKLCCEDICLIENYDKAINDINQTWDCHHRLEIDMNLSYKELIERDLYYNRPASELIFLTHSEHTSLHMNGKKLPLRSENHRKNQSQAQKGKHNGIKNPMYGKTGDKHPMYGKHRVYDNAEKTKYHYE